MWILTLGRKDFITGVWVILRERLLKLGTVKKRKEQQGEMEWFDSLETLLEGSGPRRGCCLAHWEVREKEGIGNRTMRKDRDKGPLP